METESFVPMEESEFNQLKETIEQHLGQLDQEQLNEIIDKYITYWLEEHKDQNITAGTPKKIYEKAKELKKLFIEDEERKQKLAIMREAILKALEAWFQYATSIPADFNQEDEAILAAMESNLSNFPTFHTFIDTIFN